MSDNHYKSLLEQAVFALHDVETQLFTAMVNVGFAGVYEEISQMYEHGESINLELAMFENTTDTNLDLMVELIQKIVEVKNSIMNLNNLQVDLDAYDEQADDDDEE